jgi:deoxyribodipyrimidine photolyase
VSVRVVLFTRDLRVHDRPALAAAARMFKSTGAAIHQPWRLPPAVRRRLGHPELPPG